MTLRCEVYSVFNRAVNFLLGGRLITLLSARRFLYPYSFMLREQVDFRSISFSPKMTAEINKSGLVVPEAGIKIDFTETRLLDLSIYSNGRYFVPGDLKHRLELLTLYLADNSKPGGICGLATGKESTQYSQCIKPYIPVLACALAEGDTELAGKMSAEIAGYGVGLTPSSDDFLAGFLAAYTVISIIRGKDAGQTLTITRKAGYSAAARTTDISAEFLRQSGNGMASWAVIKLLKALFSETSYNLLLSGAYQVVSIGATSGSDILTGIVLCIKHFLLNYE
jgi:hypothetical protein